MADDPKKALVMVLGKPKGDLGAADAGGEDKPSGDYDDDLKTALGDLASALGVTVEDEDKGIEALKTIHDCCARMMGEPEGDEEI